MIDTKELIEFLERKLVNARRAGLRKEIKQLTEQLASLKG
jgi:hypothetical protein